MLGDEDDEPICDENNASAEEEEEEEGEKDEDQDDDEKVTNRQTPSEKDTS